MDDGLNTESPAAQLALIILAVITFLMLVSCGRNQRPCTVTYGPEITSASGKCPENTVLTGTGTYVVCREVLVACETKP